MKSRMLPEELRDNPRQDDVPDQDADIHHVVNHIPD